MRPCCARLTLFLTNRVRLVIDPENNVAENGEEFWPPRKRLRWLRICVTRDYPSRRRHSVECAGGLGGEPVEQRRGRLWSKSPRQGSSRPQSRPCGSTRREPSDGVAGLAAPTPAPAGQPVLAHIAASCACRSPSRRQIRADLDRSWQSLGGIGPAQR